jgi:glycosyltransferase involved in cell wall biosynthesis
MERFLSAVVPISGSETKYANLLRWLPEFDSSLLEVILVGDSLSMSQESSIKNTIKIRTAHHIQFLNDSFGSPGLSRNAGMEKAQGNWICFWDCDDIPEIPNFIEMCKMANDRGFNMSMGRFTSTDVLGHVDLSNRIQAKWLSEEVVSSPGIWRTGFKHDLVENLKFEPHRMGEDQNFLQQIEQKKPTKFLYDDFVYHYFRNHPESLTSNQSSIDEIRFMLKLSYSLLQNSPQNRLLQQALLKQSVTCLKRASKPYKFTGIKLVLEFIRANPWQCLETLFPNGVRLLFFKLFIGR